MVETLAGDITMSMSIFYVVCGLNPRFKTGVNILNIYIYIWGLFAAFVWSDDVEKMGNLGESPGGRHAVNGYGAESKPGLNFMACGLPTQPCVIKCFSSFFKNLLNTKIYFFSPGKLLEVRPLTSLLFVPVYCRFNVESAGLHHVGTDNFKWSFYHL